MRGLHFLTHRETAYAQILLTILFIGGYFIILWTFMKGEVRVQADYKDAFTALLGVLTASVVQLMSYWFSRQRTSQDSAAP